MSGIQEDDDLVFHKITSLLEPLNEKGVKLTRETDIIADLEIDSVSLLDVGIRCFLQFAQPTLCESVRALCFA